MSDVTLEVKGLDQLVKALKKKPPQIKIGILGGGQREEGKLTNAEIGAFHEFGTVNLPVRSFLRMPLIDHLNPALMRANLISKKAIAEVIKSGSLLAWAEKVGVIAEGVVLTAFDTGGYGKWKPSDMRRKKVHMTLVETQQLRDSVTHEVRE